MLKMNYSLVYGQGSGRNDSEQRMVMTVIYITLGSDYNVKAGLAICIVGFDSECMSPCCTISIFKSSFSMLLKEIILYKDYQISIKSPIKVRVEGKSKIKK